MPKKQEQVLTDKEIEVLDALAERKTSWSNVERRKVVAAYKHCHNIKKIIAAGISKKSYETIRAMLIRADVYQSNRDIGV